MRLLALACAFASVLTIGCAPDDKRAQPLRPTASLPGVAEIEQAHGLERWRAEEAIRTEIVVEFGGKKTLDGILTFLTDGTKSRIDLKGGTQLVFDGEKAWVSPDSATFKQARFHLLTWPYFLAVPFKLRDGGVRVGWMGDLPLGEGKHYPALRVTFAPGTGDAPRDWYILYRDGETNRLKAMAYIVTYGKAASDKPEDPHAITYDDYRNVGAGDGVVIPTRWTFYDWVPGKGISGDPLGRATLRNVHFTDVPPGFFARPASAREDALPEPK